MKNRRYACVCEVSVVWNISMNCPDCGALMKAVPDRDYYVCEYCGSFQFPDADTEGVEVFADSTTDLDCPLCHTGLCVGSIDKQSVLFCTNCRGILTSNGGFGNLISELRGKTGAPQLPPRPIDPAELDRAIDCPRCEQRMETHPYYGPGNIVIDTCCDCRALWLDHGELTVVLES